MTNRVSRAPGKHRMLLGCGILLGFLLLAMLVAETFPVSLLLIAALALFAVEEQPWFRPLRPLIPFFRSVSFALVLVWLEDGFMRLIGPNLDAKAISGFEHMLLAVHGQLSRVKAIEISFVLIPIVGVVSAYVPRLRLLSRFLRAKKWIEYALVVTTIVTSFTFVGEVVVWGPATGKVLEHYELLIRNGEEREAAAVRNRLALKAAKQAVEHLNEPQQKELLAFAERLAPEPDRARRSLIEAAVASSTFDDGELRVTEEPPAAQTKAAADLDSRLSAATSRADSAERSASDAELALHEVVKRIFSGPKDVVVDVVFEIVKAAAFQEGSAFADIAKMFVDKAADMAWDRVADPAIEKTSTRIVERLRSRDGETPQQRVEHARESAVRERLSYLKFLLEMKANAAKELREAVEKREPGYVVRGAKVTYLDLQRKTDAYRMKLEEEGILVHGTAGVELASQFSQIDDLRKELDRVNDISAEAVVLPEVLLQADTRIEAEHVEEEAKPR